MRITESLTLNSDMRAAQAHPVKTAGAEFHVILNICALPGYYDASDEGAVYDCDVDASSTPAGMPNALTCAAHQKTQRLYVWTKGADPYDMPPGVGFRVGGDTGYEFLVLRVHFKSVQDFLSRGQDPMSGQAGLSLIMSTPTPGQVIKTAGSMSVGARGLLPPHQVTNVEGAMKMTDPVSFHPFAIQSHTHSLGLAVTTWKVSPDGQWTLIARRNPQRPEIWKPIPDKGLIVNPGDIVAVRCTFNNTQSHVVSLM